MQLVEQCKGVETEKVEKRGEVEWVGVGRSAGCCGRGKGCGKPGRERVCGGVVREKG